MGREKDTHTPGRWPPTPWNSQRFWPRAGTARDATLPTCNFACSWRNFPILIHSLLLIFTLIALAFLNLIRACGGHPLCWTSQQPAKMAPVSCSAAPVTANSGEARRRGLCQEATPSAWTLATGEGPWAPVPRRSKHSRGPKDGTATEYRYPRAARNIMPKSYRYSTPHGRDNGRLYWAATSSYLFPRTAGGTDGASI